jgi:hypothetical protein
MGFYWQILRGKRCECGESEMMNGEFGEYKIKN